MTSYWLVIFDLLENKQFTRYYENEFKKDKAKIRFKKYLGGRYLILSDSSDEYYE